MTEPEKQTGQSSTALKVYVASSWRNVMQRAIVHLLRAAGHEVYDFREPTEGNHGFSWHEINPTIPRGPADLTLPADQILAMLGHPAAEDGFALDMGALEWCDACVLVLPCGRSAHLEAGWAVGAGKRTVGLLCEGEPDLMWKMLDHLVVHPSEVLDVLGWPVDAQDEAAGTGSDGGVRRRGVEPGVAADAMEAERADLAAGYAPRRWRCGYVGDGGTMADA